MEYRYNISNLTNSLVSISRFNRGEANKIFDEVRETGVKIVLKNNSPACVLLTPEAYEEMLETIEDYRLLLEAKNRMENSKEKDCLPVDQVIKELGINDADLKDIDVELD